jgi:hypothetical protein
MTNPNQDPSTQSSSDDDESFVPAYDRAHASFDVWLYEEDESGSLYLFHTGSRLYGYKLKEWTDGFPDDARFLLHQVDTFCEAGGLTSDDLTGPEYKHVASYSIERGVHDINNPGAAGRRYLGLSEEAT